MSIDLQTALVKVSSGVIKLDKKRMREKKHADYETLREAMYTLHVSWQSTIRAVKDRKDITSIANAALKLASAAVKLSTDLSSSILNEDLDPEDPNPTP